MPIIADPEQLALIAVALEDYRKSKSVDPGSALYQRAAQRVICLFEAGMRDPQAMSKALADALETCPASAFYRPPRLVDKERMERATREAKPSLTLMRRVSGPSQGARTIDPTAE